MSVEAVGIVATGMPASIEDYQLALNAAFAGGVAAGKTVAEAEKQEPAAWIDRTCLKNLSDDFEPTISIRPVSWYDIPLYTHPQPKREWVGLTDEEASACWTYNDRTSWRNIEAKLKEKNT